MAGSIAAALEATSLRTASPWDDITTLKAKSTSPNPNWDTLLNKHITGFVDHSKGKEYFLEDLPLKWFEIPTVQYYGDMMFGLQSKDIPALESVVAAGDSILLTPRDFDILMDLQKKRGYNFMVTADFRPAMIKRFNTMKLSVRNATVNGF